MKQTNRPKKILSGCAIIENRKLLLLYKIKQSYYEFPGGKLEEKESLENCAIREASEEINCDVRLKKKWGPYEFSLDINDVESNVFESEIINGTPKITEKAFSECIWMPIDEYNKYPLAPNVKMFIEEYISKSN